MTKIASLKQQLIDIEQKLNLDQHNDLEHAHIRISSVKSTKGNSKAKISSSSEKDDKYYKKYVEAKKRIESLEEELKNEKQKNKELQKQVKEYQGKAIIKEKTLAQIKKLQEDYEILIKSFNYSEEIRKKQKKIIKKLSYITNK